MAESGSISGVRERHLRRLFSLAFILLLFILLRRLDQEAIANFGLDQGLDQLFHPIRKKKDIFIPAESPIYLRRSNACQWI